jgi:cell wall assembly regulator SMI1
LITFLESETPITRNDIAHLENLLKLKLPEEYKNHLLKHNGGRCKPNVFKFHENNKLARSNVDWFLAIYEGKYDNLNKYIENFKLDRKRMPFHMVPIAHDPGGNLICISCGQNDYGFIYFWDHENEVDYKKAKDDNY